MAEPALLLPLLLLFLLLPASPAADDARVLSVLKASLDPGGQLLSSWASNGDPCDGTFVGVACDSRGRVTNVSLQGRGLAGSIPDAIGELTSLTALYLHYNSLTGAIPSALGQLDGLTDLYLNVNKLTGSIPRELGGLDNLQALQLCCNQLTGSIPDGLGHLKLLTLLSLQHNHLQGRIPPSLGQLSSLTHLDLGYNQLQGTIPASLNNLPQMALLDVRNNNLSGSVPPGLRNLERGFVYTNNTGLCGRSFSDLPSCAAAGSRAGATALQRPEPLGAMSPLHSTPPTVLVQPEARARTDDGAAATSASRAHKGRLPQMAILAGVLAVTLGLLIAGSLFFVAFRRHKQRISTSHDGPDKQLEPAAARSTQAITAAPLAKEAQLLLPLAMHSNLMGSSMRSFQFRLDELEMATNYFSEKHLLARKSYMSIYRAVLRDGSTVVIKHLSKTKLGGCKEELETAMGSLMQLKHENLVRLKGFCCLNGGLQCYLVYDYVYNGSLFEHLHGGAASSSLDWTSRLHIARGVAKGLDYLHRNGEQVVVWASNILLDDNYNALISSWGLSNKILADEVVYANVKTSAMLGYLAPEYGMVGHLNEKSDVYAFGILLLELLTGRKPLHTDGVTSLANFARPLLLDFQPEVVDPSLASKFSTAAAAGVASIASACINILPEERPTMGQVVQSLHELGDRDGDAAGFSSGEEYPSRPSCLDYGR